MITQVVPRVSELGNQYNNGLHQDQICDNPDACFLFNIGRAKIVFGWSGVGADAPSKFFMNSVGLPPPPPPPPLFFFPDLLCVWSSRSKYTAASTISYSVFFRDTSRHILLFVVGGTTVVVLSLFVFYQLESVTRLIFRDISYFLLLLVVAVFVFYQLRPVTRLFFRHLEI